jgi:dipeptidyl aminopeptidase/acylaminoacyl peptidase
MFYLHTNEGDFGQVHFYALDLAHGTRTALTSAEGRQDVVLSPDEKTMAVLHSTANHPPELYLQPNRVGAAARQVTEGTTAEFRSYAWTKPEIVMIPARDGVGVPGRLYRPLGVPSNHAAVVFVHGAGYLQNVHKWWSSYAREYMFHHLLASRGYTVLDLDYRGSAGYGRVWRTAIYRYMGGTDLDDQIDGARWLVRQQGIDSTKIGVYGGSYGGFITLMAMFTRPGVFASGAALRPVTDWSHYNHPYTARILNEPQGDTLAYRRSSPIYHAAGLQGRLLICHGMVDDNVHFQDTARLTQRLIELGKEGWEVAMYPVERHGFQRADSWTDEYRRIFKLFESTLR